MAIQMLQNVTTYIDSHDFTGDTNQATLETDVNELDASTFASAGWKDVIGGIKSSKFSQAGLWQAGTGSIDADVFPNLSTRRVHTMGPAGTEATVAYLWQAGHLHYVPMEGAHGDIAGYSLDSSGQDGYGVVRGQWAAIKQTVSTTGAFGTAINLGDPGGTKYVYASLHIFSAGTTITVRVESDTASNFPSATTVATFTAQTAAGGVWLPRVLGTSGEMFYRFNVASITGSFSIAGAIGVQ